MTPAATNMLSAQRMLGERIGLTITYNRLKDAAVLAAYGWSDIPVRPFCLATDAEKKAFEAFESEVIDRLFALNAKRAEGERIAGAGTAPEPQAKAKKAASKKGRPGGGGRGSLEL